MFKCLKDQELYRKILYLIIFNIIQILFMEMYVIGIFNSYNIDKDEFINEYLILDVNN